jgi:hypothetical protein
MKAEEYIVISGNVTIHFDTLYEAQKYLKTINKPYELYVIRTKRIG